VKAFGPEEAAHADLYRPLAQSPFPLLAFAVRTTGDPAALLKPAEQVIWDIDKDQPIFDAMPMTLLAAQSVTLRRVSTMLAASFATLALVLVAVGLYGVMAYSVSQGTRELGLRMALGARGVALLRSVMSEGIVLMAAGVTLGAVAALSVTRLLGDLLYKTSPRDPLAFALAFAVITLVSLAACFVPAYRASQTDPVRALRDSV
jgi:ABC-type antimicrobial peptide transport system permease subunit